MSHAPFCSGKRLRKAAVGTPELFHTIETDKPLQSDWKGETPEDFANRLFEKHRKEFTGPVE